MNIGIVGTRSRDSLKDFVETAKVFLAHYKEGDCICSGLCPKGGDRFAVLLANVCLLTKEQRIWFPAEWAKYGKGAGFKRNTEIANNSDILIACVALDRKGGTEDTIRKFLLNHDRKFLLIVEETKWCGNSGFGNK